MITPRQQAIYRPLVKRAWLAHCAGAGLSPEADAAYETWYRHQLMGACGIYTTKQANPTKDFDRLIARFAEIAGDADLAMRAAEGDERRLRHLIASEVKRGAVTEAYVLGIARNMGFPRDSLADLPAEHLWRVWNALLRHNRRHASNHAAPGRARSPSAPSQVPSSEGCPQGGVGSSAPRSALNTKRSSSRPRVSMPMPF